VAKPGTEKNPLILRVKHEKRAMEVAAICEEHGWKYIVGVEPDEVEDVSDLDRMLDPQEPVVKDSQISRNAPCPCGSGKKYKKCCMNNTESHGEKPEPKKETPRCGLCGRTKNLTKTECCDQWICDDEGDYVMFSYDHNSCIRNHRRYTLCGHHFADDHAGQWKDCKKCKTGCETEMYVYYGTNEYNFERLRNPPSYKPKKCKTCGKAFWLSQETHSVIGRDYLCEKCSYTKFEDLKKNLPSTP